MQKMLQKNNNKIVGRWTNKINRKKKNGKHKEKEPKAARSETPENNMETYLTTKSDSQGSSPKKPHKQHITSHITSQCFH